MYVYSVSLLPRNDNMVCYFIESIAFSTSRLIALISIYFQISIISLREIFYLILACVFVGMVINSDMSLSLIIGGIFY